jgi:ubiquinone/menaquinone biosynthesis C-methylase UbiE
VTAARRLAAILAADDALVYLAAVLEIEMHGAGLRRKICDFAIAAASNSEDSAAISGRPDFALLVSNPARRARGVRVRRLPRVNYDGIADLYDAQPYRARTADPELLAFAEQRASADLAVLDIGCGTGNQVIANRVALPHAWCTGLDRSFGMLRQARLKAPELAWLRADGAVLPFAVRSFDFVCCQFAFHHLEDKAGMLRAVLQVLRPGGRFVLRNMCPQESADWLYYKYFPEARLVDLQIFGLRTRWSKSWRRQAL